MGADVPKQAGATATVNPTSVTTGGSATLTIFTTGTASVAEDYETSAIAVNLALVGFFIARHAFHAGRRTRGRHHRNPDDIPGAHGSDPRRSTTTNASPPSCKPRPPR